MGAKGQKLTVKQRRKISDGRRKGYLASLERKPVAEPELKRCCGCGEWKRRGSKSEDSDFHWRRRTKSKSGVVRFYPESRCKVCRRTQNREITERERAEGVDIQARWRLWFSRQSVRYQQELLRRKRERETALRRELGAQPQRGRYQEREAVEGKRLSPQPLVDLLNKELSASSPGLLAEQSGVDQRRIYGLLHGEYEQVSLSVVDRLLHGLGLPHMLPILYPEED